MGRSEYGEIEEVWQRKDSRRVKGRGKEEPGVAKWKFARCETI